MFVLDAFITISWENGLLLSNTNKQRLLSLFRIVSAKAEYWTWFTCMISEKRESIYSILTQTDSNFQIFKKRRRGGGEEREASFLKKNKRKRYRKGVRGEELFFLGGLLFMCGFEWGNAKASFLVFKCISYQSFLISKDQVHSMWQTLSSSTNLL